VGPLPEVFADALRKTGGHVALLNGLPEVAAHLAQIFTENKWSAIACPEKLLAKTLKQVLPEWQFSSELTEETEVVVTQCEALVAGTGSVILSTALTSSRKAIVYGPAQVVIASVSQIFPDAESAMESLAGGYKESPPSLLSVITGPSRTADIEKTLILGAHGPKALHVLVCDNNLTEYIK
jgi:L-lactate dehydrogenase complex protein LldG